MTPGEKIAEWAFAPVHGRMTPAGIAKEIDRAISDAVKPLVSALQAVDAAYCGVGDTQGTGENMASVIVEVRQALGLGRTEKPE